MSAEEKVAVLTQALEEICEATYAQFQIEWDPDKGPFDKNVHVCPMCRRASTAKHLKSKWALIHSVAAQVLRDIEEGGSG
jgi:uncharacterized MAPEG superfamily protein